MIVVVGVVVNEEAGFKLTVSTVFHPFFFLPQSDLLIVSSQHENGDNERFCFAFLTIHMTFFPSMESNPNNMKKVIFEYHNYMYK